MKNSLRIHKWTHNEFNIFILGVLTHPLVFFAISHVFFRLMRKHCFTCRETGAKNAKKEPLRVINHPERLHFDTLPLFTVF